MRRDFANTDAGPAHGDEHQYTGPAHTDGHQYARAADGH